MGPRAGAPRISSAARHRAVVSSDLGFMVLDPGRRDGLRTDARPLLPGRIFAPSSSRRRRSSTCRNCGRSVSSRSATCSRTDASAARVAQAHPCAAGSTTNARTQWAAASRDTAGLFGTTRATSTPSQPPQRASRAAPRHPAEDLVDLMADARHPCPARRTCPLGWDTPSPRRSLAGTKMSQHTVGHLGFTGVSLWLDLERGVNVVLLTNRVHPTRDNDKSSGSGPGFTTSYWRPFVGRPVSFEDQLKVAPPALDPHDRHQRRRHGGARQPAHGSSATACVAPTSIDLPAGERQARAPQRPGREGLPRGEPRAASGPRRVGTRSRRRIRTSRRSRNSRRSLPEALIPGVCRSSSARQDPTATFWRRCCARRTRGWFPVPLVAGTHGRLRATVRLPSDATVLRCPQALLLNAVEFRPRRHLPRPRPRQTGLRAPHRPAARRRTAANCAPTSRTRWTSQMRAGKPFLVSATTRRAASTGRCAGSLDTARRAALRRAGPKRSR